jgi:hypothetical protein
MKTAMLQSIHNRFNTMEKLDFLLLSTALDPRFKDKFFSSSVVCGDVKQKLKQLCYIDYDNNENSDDIDEPLMKKPNNDDNESEFWSCFSELLEESGIDNGNDGDEVDQFFSEGLIDIKKGCPYNWWNTNKDRFPQLSKLSIKFLCYSN